MSPRASTVCLSWAALGLVWQFWVHPVPECVIAISPIAAQSMDAARGGLADLPSRTNEWYHCFRCFIRCPPIGRLLTERERVPLVLWVPRSRSIYGQSNTLKEIAMDLRMPQPSSSYGLYLPACSMFK